MVVSTNRDSPFLAEALDSVEMQTYPEWELIVVDNGVPDPEALAALVARHPRASLVPGPRRTVSVARNVGVAAAQGSLLVFLDDDDVWAPGRLEEQVRSLELAPEAPASYTGGWHMDASGAEIPPEWPAVPATAAQMLSGERRVPHICGAMLIRREHYEAVGGFSAEMSMMEDFELAIRLLQFGTFDCVPGRHVGYRRHGENTTSTTPANVHLRRTAIAGVLRRQVWAAEARGANDVAELLRRHLHRHLADAAREAGGSVLAELRRGRTPDLRRDLRWGLRADAPAFLSGAAARLGAFLQRRGAAQRAVGPAAP